MNNCLIIIKILILGLILSSCGNTREEKYNSSPKNDTNSFRRSGTSGTVKQTKKDSSINDTINVVEQKLLSPLIIDKKCINNICLGASLKSIVSSNDYVVKDTLFEEEASWPGKAVLNKKGEVILLFEASWNKVDFVSRISVLGKEIRTIDSITVGAKFKDIKKKISKEVPNAPDGYIMVISKNNDNLFFEFDTDGISQSSPLLYNLKNIDNIPDSIKIKYILIM